MQINIQSIHFDADQKLLDFVQKKAAKLETLNHRIIDLEIYLKLDKADNHANKITELKLHMPGTTLFAKEQRKTFEESTDLAIDHLKQQLAKRKD